MTPMPFIMSPLPRITPVLIDFYHQRTAKPIAQENSLQLVMAIIILNPLKLIIISRALVAEIKRLMYCRK